MTRLRRSDCLTPGISRRRRGRGFSYSWDDRNPVTDREVLERIEKLVIPPAWADVWICPWPNGHIQATGTDAAGRRQYRYHDDWRVRRDHEKFERVLSFAAELPRLRSAVAKDLALPGLGRARVLAGAVRLLDVGYFRVGGAEYAEEHETFGLSSLLKEHVSLARGVISFQYPAKGSIERRVEIRDEQAYALVSSLRRRRSGGPNLFAYRERDGWREVHSEHVNAYIKDAAGDDYSAKDFRTWSATVLAAVALARQASNMSARARRVTNGTVTAPSSRKKAVTAAIAEVASELGNTPAVCRSSYIDARIVDRFHTGETIAKRLAELPPVDEIGDADLRRAVDEAVIDLLVSPAPSEARQAA